MIDATLLRQLGWTEELIGAVTRVAEPMRDYPAAGFPLPEPNFQFVSTTAVYSDSLVSIAACDLKVDAIETKAKKKNDSKEGTVRPRLRNSEG